jgi:serine/threonine protein kinase
VEPPGLIDGRYRVVGELGRGGTGVVYEAVDERLDRRVAVKLLHVPDGEAERARRMLVHEARAAARLRHPHAVTVHEVSPGVGADPPYLVMELLAGWSLHERVRRHGPVPPERAAAMGAQLADCLRAAHAAGLVHRDVKPSNVIVGDEGAATLTDFGIAGLPTDQQVTLWGTVIGSPPYLSPEQAAGADATPASDWWSLGATLYFAVEGHPPFERPNALATLNAVRNEPPAPMRRAGVLAPVLHALLTKDPAARPTGDDILASLRALTDQPPDQPAPPPPPDRSRRRIPLLAAAAAAALVAGGTTAAVLATHPWRTTVHHTSSPPTTSLSPPPTTGGPAGDRIRWQGELTFGALGVILDPVPPVVSHDSSGEADLATTASNDPFEGLGTDDNRSSIVAWTGADVPTRQQCADLLRAAGPHSIGLVPAPPGTAACVHTFQGRTAYLNVTEIGTDQGTDDHCTINVIVWEN